MRLEQSIRLTSLLASRVMKTEDDGSRHPSSDYLVVEDPKEVSKWHLPVYDLAHMGAAWAALTAPEGHRGNKYEGPDKQKAIAKLTRMYHAKGLKTPDEKEKEARSKEK